MIKRHPLGDALLIRMIQVISGLILVQLCQSMTLIATQKHFELVRVLKADWNSQVHLELSFVGG